MRPALIVTADDGAERRVLAELEGKPWAAEDGEPWCVTFALELDPDRARAVELSVAPDITVALRGQPAGDGTRTRRSGTGAAPRAGDDAPSRRPGARAQDLQRLTTRVTALEAALEREQERRTEADAALDGQRAEHRRLSAELGRVRAELELAQAAQREALQTGAQLQGARREIASLQTRYDAMSAEHDRALVAHAGVQDDLRRRSGELDAARDALGDAQARDAARVRDAPGGASRVREDEVVPHARAQVSHAPPPPRSARPVNPALRSRRKWLVRLLALVVLAAFLVAVYLVLHSTVLH